MPLQKIEFKSLKGFRVGNAQNYEAMTGVTALVFDCQNTAGIDISGGGPAARESFLFSPLAYQQSITALLLSGGSAYGLEAASGAMKYLEEKGMGYKIAGGVVPIVPQSCIFDLQIGSAKIRPDIKMGYEACVNSETNNPVSGIIGGGTGATVGKIFGMERAQKAGIGYSAFKLGELEVGAVAVVNALGDIFDYQSGKKIAGALTPDRKEFASSEEGIFALPKKIQEGANTTIGAVIMNADFSQQQMCKIAAMTRSALARSINPVGTTADGDTIYAITTGKVKSDINAAGTLACRALSEAITDAVKSSRMSDSEYLNLIKGNAKS
ncbi:P1 family peptidase [Treponema sp.]|uniref:P1 family peptidase n=1 Tax=Treponema sp. TaxID=166 RepID=UPI003F10E6C1